MSHDQNNVHELWFFSFYIWQIWWKKQNSINVLHKKNSAHDQKKLLNRMKIHMKCNVQNTIEQRCFSWNNLKQQRINTWDRNSIYNKMHICNQMPLKKWGSNEYEINRRMQLEEDEKRMNINMKCTE